MTDFLSINLTDRAARPIALREAYWRLGGLRAWRRLVCLPLRADRRITGRFSMASSGSCQVYGRVISLRRRTWPSRTETS